MEETDGQVRAELVEMGYDDIRKNFLTGARTGKPAAIEDLSPTISEYFNADLLEPIGDRAKELSWFDGYRDSAIQALTSGDELYGLPFRTNTRGLLYRKDILEEYGWEQPRSAEQLIEIGSEITKNREKMYGFNPTTKTGDIRTFQEFLSYTYQFTDNVYVRNGDSWSLDVSADQLGKVLKSYYYDPYFRYDPPAANPENRNGSWQQNDVGYLSGTYATVQGGTWFGGIANDEQYVGDAAGGAAARVFNDNSALAHLPVIQGGNQGAYSEVKGVLMNRFVEDKNAAWAAISELCSPALLKKDTEVSGNNAVPVHEDIESTLTDEDFKVLVEIFDTASSVAFIKWGKPREAIYNTVQQVIYDEQEPFKAGKDLHEELKSLESEV
jgi:ABC-type glycerol-3-phosphate transport system substrate-binding protein